MEQSRMDTTKGMEFVLYSIGEHLLNPHTGTRISAEQHIREMLEER